jgi:tetratricopeptide (TPR) repeat protein
VDSSRNIGGLLAVGLLLTGFFLWQISQHSHNPFPPLTASLSTPESDLTDFAGIALGMRRLAADLAWIQTLQYYGTPEADQSEADFENGWGHYPKFLALCQRVTHIDPFFTAAYYYGSAVLGWNLNRLDEATELLKEGIAKNPKEWRLEQYLAALAYQKNHDMKNLAKFLESMVQDPDCPNLLKAILANIYKKQGDYAKAIKLWLVIYDSGDPAYHLRAQEQIQLMQAHLGIPSLTK